MLIILFNDVKRHYKTLPTQIHACTMAFPNTCAIRMSEALVAAKPEVLAIFKRSGKNVCPHGYVRGAQDIASVLARPDLLGPRTLGFERPVTMPPKLQGQHGIISFMNIPTYAGQGHIDLWDGTRTVGPNSEYWDASPIWFWRLA
jgi:hypothetical protein